MTIKTIGSMSLIFKRGLAYFLSIKESRVRDKLVDIS